jgi:hypothetical protein
MAAPLYRPNQCTAGWGRQHHLIFVMIFFVSLGSPLKTAKIADEIQILIIIREFHIRHFRLVRPSDTNCAQRFSGLQGMQKRSFSSS